MPTEYTLTYFDISAWAEPARYILAHTGAVWKDNRIPFAGYGSPIPDKIKARTKYGQVPMLEFAGKKLVQSMTIARYLAQEYRLTGKDRFEAALCDEYVDTCKDVLNLFTPHFLVEDAEKRADLFKQATESAKERFLSKFNAVLVENGGHLVGKSFTWADIYVACHLEQVEQHANVKLTTDLPALARLLKTVFEAKGIKEYRAQRAQSNK
jgi:glutathione S-transferase